MPEEPQPLLDQRLIQAVANPSRMAILEALISQDGLSVGEISERLDIRAANVHYHASVLAAAGAIEAVEAGGGADVTERRFRLAPLTVIGNQRWGDLSPQLRDEISTALLRRFMDGAAHMLPDD